jgi:hypothetical protein
LYGISSGGPEKEYSSEQTIRIMLEGLRGEVSNAELCRRESKSKSLGANTAKNKPPAIGEEVRKI